MSKSKNATNTLENLFKKFPNFKIAISTFVILLGFIYVKGLFSGFTAKFSYMDFFIGNSELPIPVEIYVLNGFVFIFSLSIQTITAYIILHILSFLRNAYLKSRIKRGKILYCTSLREDVGFRVYYKIQRICMYIYFIFPPAVLLLFKLHKKYKIQNSDHYYELYILWSINIVYITVTLIGFTFLKKWKKYSNRGRSKEFYQVYQLLFLLAFFLSSVYAVYYNGAVYQDIKIQRALISDRGFDFVKVYYKNNSTMVAKGYFKLYLTKEFFLGYDNVEKSTIFIPTCWIYKIEKWVPTGNMKSYMKYSTNAVNSQSQIIIGVVENYYKYRTGNFYGKSAGKINAGEVVKLVTDTYYSENFQLLSPQILNNKWTLTGVYNGKLLKNFCGFEISIPYKATENQYSVYVMESWTDFNEYLEYSIVKIKEQWLIDSIKNKNDPFRLYIQ